MPAEAPEAQKVAAPLTVEVKYMLQTAVDSGKPVFIFSRSGHPPFIVLEGKQAYWINFSAETLRNVAMQGDIWAHPGRMNTVSCVAGCKKNVTPWWTIVNNML